MPVFMARSQWTKEAILREAKSWAIKNGYEWKPGLEQMAKEWLALKLLVPTGRYDAGARQAKVLIYTNPSPELTLSERGLRNVLRPGYELPKASPRAAGKGKRPNGKQASKPLSKSARRKRDREARLARLKAKEDKKGSN